MRKHRFSGFKNKLAGQCLWAILRGLLVAAIWFANAASAAAIEAGLYYDPDHNGHGFDLQPAGNRWVMVFYSYDAAGNPEWLLGVLDADSDGQLKGSLESFDYQVDRLPAQARSRIAGNVELAFSQSCSSTEKPLTVNFRWELDGHSGEWCVEPLLSQKASAAPDYTGLWFAGEADAGWGLSLDFEGDVDQQVEVQVLFYYDAAGKSRWALGSGPGGASAHISLSTFAGYCRSCAPVDLKETSAGVITHQLSLSLGRPVGVADIDVDDRSDSGSGSWVRQATPLQQLSDPKRGLMPLPGQLNPDQSFAIINTTVVPMTDSEGVLEGQTVVVRDGHINAIGDYGSVALPADTFWIDGRDYFVGPGLHDMHTHFSFGGPVPMREAGTLYIANGVTTVLNMGDGGTQNLPATDEIFATAQFIGPTVYAGAAAYGPGDGRSANLTVATPAEATAFANNALNEGYQLIKLYNTLSPPVVEQFIEEGKRLGMPVNGHLPKTMTMQASLTGGQGMIAHVAEIYFTLLANQPNDALLAQAAELMLANNTYLTDTLTASESFAANYGGNEENYLRFSRRDGINYQPTTFAERGWRNFFESSTLSPPGSRAGQLDSRLAFFKKMTRFFSDAGVPLMLGTDSPGHIGLVSGFAVHEHLRIYSEIGLSPFAAYQAASVNPGRYLSESMNLTGWGTVESGSRADLLLLSGNPLESTSHLKRPAAVITRGRLYSRVVLDEALARLDEKYPDPFTQIQKGHGRMIEHEYGCTHDGH